MSPITKNHMYI